MSSGGGGDTPIRWGEGGGDDCDLRFETELLNPDPSEIASLMADSPLRIELDEQRMSILATSNGQRVGSIGNNVPVLVRCIRAGNQYLGRVVTIDGGRVVVAISHA
jgi:hypothetical protein